MVLEETGKGLTLHYGKICLYGLIALEECIISLGEKERIPLTNCLKSVHVMKSSRISTDL